MRTLIKIWGIMFAADNGNACDIVSQRVNHSIERAEKFILERTQKENRPIVICGSGARINK